jgi:hypothetical protein
MAAPNTHSFGKFKVYLDLDGTGSFAAPCGFNENSLRLSKAVNETIIPDCDDPDAAQWTETDAVSRSLTVSGQGIMAVESSATWRNAWLENDSIPIRVMFDVVLAKDGGYWSGNAHVTQLEFGAARGNRITCSVEITGDGAFTWVAAGA